MPPTDGPLPLPKLLCAALAASALAGCGLFSPPPPAPAAAAPVEEAPPPPPPPPPAPPVTVYVPVVEPADQAARHLLAYQERLARLGPQGLAPELQRLGDGSVAPQSAMELALVLGSTRAPGDLQRALALLDAVQRNPDASAWHGLARLLAARYAEQRRAEEQAERLAQQLRDAQRDNQRRLDQLNEKLEALKSIERSLNSRPPASPASPASPSAPGSAPRPAP